MAMVDFKVALLVGFVSLISWTITAYGQSSETECRNELEDEACERLEKFGTCLNDMKRMNKWCPKTCGFCGNACKDWYPHECPKWLRHQACFTHRQQMKKWCKKTCGFCRSPSPPKSAKCASSPFGCCWDRHTAAFGPNMEGCGQCQDKLRLCRAFWIDCYSARNQRFMYRNCPKTCLLCKEVQNKYFKQDVGVVLSEQDKGNSASLSGALEVENQSAHSSAEKTDKKE